MSLAAGGERPILFGCEGERLVGILNPAKGSIAVVIIVGGPQYRAGSRRQFVHLGRALAQAGYPALRFDVRGMGDSTGPLHAFEQITPDIGAAINALVQQQPQVRGVALLGLCDAASAAMLYLQARPDPRVTGLCLLNPWIRSAASLARTHVKHYYVQRLAQRTFWVKLFKGRVAMGALRSFAENLRTARGRDGRTGPAAFQDRMAAGWRAFEGPTLLVLSGEDYTAKEFSEYVAGHSTWAGLLTRREVQIIDIAGADHTFSGAVDRVALQSAVHRWLAALQ